MQQHAIGDEVIVFWNRKGYIGRVVDINPLYVSKDSSTPRLCYKITGLPFSFWDTTMPLDEIGWVYWEYVHESIEGTLAIMRD